MYTLCNERHCFFLQFFICFREDLRGAIRDFEDEFGSSVEDDDEKETIVQARHGIAAKFKSELLDQLRSCLRTQTVNDLGLAIAKVESPLTHYLMEQYKIQDPEIAILAKTANEIYALECEVQRQLDNVMHIKDSDIKEMLEIQEPPPILFDAFKGTLLLLGYSHEEMTVRVCEMLKLLFSCSLHHSFVLKNNLFWCELCFLFNKFGCLFRVL